MAPRLLVSAESPADVREVRPRAGQRSDAGGTGMVDRRENQGDGMSGSSSSGSGSGSGSGSQRDRNDRSDRSRSDQSNVEGGFKKDRGGMSGSSSSGSSD